MTESDAPSGVLDTRNIVICVVLAAILFISPHPQDIKWLTSSLGKYRLAQPHPLQAFELTERPVENTARDSQQSRRSSVGASGTR